ncbi:MAG: asparagine synthase (glutamine-hydrolyzing) [Ignavibacteria bacterium]|nr:asparagine synthase (glutamine-hydrolyzing) [Ignavibacteria bacterium]
MCGICGIFGITENEGKKEKTLKMMDLIHHRGPDNKGFWSDEKVSMGFVRLSIIDLSESANQPMTDENGRYIITFNGEIYNYIEIREVLKSKGYIFRTSTDTEVLLKAYMEWGKDSFEMLNGMFAFAIYDIREKKILLVRDRYGIKPLYYYYDGSVFVYCSEITPIVNLIPGLKEQNNEAIFNYLVFNRTDYDEGTFFKKVKRIKHGHYAEICDKFEMKKWYDLRQRIDGHIQEGNLVDKLESSIKLRLRSDVPVGVCLSGGIDSSSIMSILTGKMNRHDINSFSAVYEDDFEFNERKFIDLYRTELDEMYFTTPTAETLFNDKETFVKAHGEPIPSTSPYAQFKVMELASKHVKVTLDGQGADEELAGYHYFFGNYYKELLMRFRFIRLISEMISYYGKHNSLYAYKTFLYYLMPAYLKTKIRGDKAGYLDDEFYTEFRKDNKIAGELYSSSSLKEALFKHFEMKLEHLLKWEDRNSMHFSLEARLPFLDYRVVEHCLSLPSADIIRKGMTKHALREEMKGLLPERIRIRTDKTGFDTPEGEWFRKKIFRNYIMDMLSSERFRSYGFIDAEKAKALYNMHLEEKVNISKEIWKWINLDLWREQFIG